MATLLMLFLLAKFLKANSLIRRMYTNQQNILPRKLTPDSLGVFLTGAIQSSRRRIGFTNHIYRDMRIEMVSSNLIAGTDGNKMFVGAPVFSEKWWQEEMFIEDPTIELAIAFVYGVASHEAAHCLVFSQDRSFTSVPELKMAQCEYVKTGTKYYYDEALAIKVASLVEDIIVEENILRKNSRFAPYIPYLNISLSVTFSLERLYDVLAKSQDIKQVLSNLAFFIRNKEIAVSNILFQSDEVQEMADILSNAAKYGVKARNETLLELYDYILSKEQEDQEEKQKEQEENEQEDSNDDGDEKESDEEGQEKESGGNGGKEENEEEQGKGKQKSKNNNGNKSGKENSDESENEDENGGKENGQDNSGTENSDEKENESQGDNRISQSGKEKLDSQLGSDVASKTPSNQNGDGTSGEIMDSGFADGLSEKEIQKLVKMMQSSDVKSAVIQQEKEMQIWQDVIRSTENFESRTKIDSERTDLYRPINENSPQFLEQMKQVSESFKQLKTKQKKRALYQKQGEIDGDSLDAVFTGEVFESKLVTGNKKRRAKVVIIIDNSGSTESRTENIGHGMKGHLRLDLYSCAYSIFELLTNAGYPTLAIAHTTNGNGGLIYNIASYEMPFIGETELLTTDNPEQRFNNVFRASETNYNADGWVLSEAVKTLKNHPMTGDDMVIFLSDGQPSAAPHGNAREYFIEEIANARQDKTFVFGFAATKDVIPALKVFYGDEFTYDISDENMGETVSQMLQNAISAY